MKLLQEMARRVKEVGRLRKAWFTTFNLSFDLLETHILPVLVGCDVPRTAAQYEAIQVQLGEENIDVRVFCDTRTVRTEARKRTSVPVHRIDFRSAGLIGDETRFAVGYFHPKVIYLEGENGAVIGAGSANLSTDAWGKNRECFHFQVIRDSNNLREIEGFFRRIHQWAGVEEGMLPLQVAGTDQFDTEAGWAFVSSLSEQSFLRRLLGANESLEQNLTVWSPYFSDDLGQLVQLIKDSYPLGKLRLVPDIKDWSPQSGGRMRVSESSAKALLEAGSEFWRDILFLKASPVNPRFSHAKLWHTSHRIGIGSWNFTGPALGLGSKSNVEAGIVLQRTVDPSGLERMPDPVQCAMGQAELEKESLDLLALNAPAVAIRVLFDWKERAWEWVCVPLGWTIKNAQLRLPKMTVELSERLTGRVAAPLGFRLVERHVAVDFLRDGTQESELVWVEERNAQERPPGGFETLDSLFVELLQNDPGKALEGDRIVFAGDEEEADDGDAVTSHAAAATNISYFRMFAGMRQARLRFGADSVMNPDTLRRRIHVEPGCLVELYQKVMEHCEGSDAKQSSMSGVARWFWYTELQLVIIAACGAAERLESDLISDLKTMAESVSNFAHELEPEPDLLSKIRFALEKME